MELDAFRCGHHYIETLHYIPEFITKEQEGYFLNRLQDGTRLDWKEVCSRRVRVFGGHVTTKGLIVDPRGVPPYLRDLMDDINDKTGAFSTGRANHCLVNSYEPGIGIFQHEDGPAYTPVVCILSLCSSAVLRFYPKTEDGPAPAPVASIFLEPRSLLLFRDAAYTNFFHGIDSALADLIDETVVNALPPGVTKGDTIPRGPGPRVSLTIRRVEQEIKGLTRLLS